MEPAGSFGIKSFFPAPSLRPPYSVKLFSKRLAAVFQSPFFRGSFTYLSGSILNSALPLLVVPVLTRYLSPADYGLVATSTVLTQILIVFIGLNAYGLVARSHFDDDPAGLRRLVSTSVLLSLAVAALLLGLAFLLGGPVARITQFPAAWLPAVILIALASVFQGVYLGLVQARSEPLLYISVQTIGGVLNLGLSLLLVVQFGMDWRGRMWALVLSLSAVALFCLHGLIFRLGLLRPVFHGTACRQLMAFGVPLIPHVIGGWVMTMAARLYLNNMASVSDTGLYSLAFNLTSPLSMIIGAANNAFMPTLFQRLSGKEAFDKVQFCRVLLGVALALPLLALLGAMAARFALPFLVGRKFYAASEYMTWMALTYAVQGVYFIFGNFVVYSKQTSLMTWRADFLGGVVLMIACPVLIRMNGPIGAAQATCVAFTASTLGCITAARKAYPMPWGTALMSMLRLRGSMKLKML